jgi:tRNA threonylcarbamoyladenosine biosynthesis protein TsaE
MELSSLQDTQNLSKKISRIIKLGDTILLYGEIGVGKTTLVRYLINHLEVENKIKESDILSPTFNIIYDYDIRKIKIHHYDLYRVKNNKDILELGMFENSKNFITIVEWPELIESKPKDRIDIYLQYSKLTNSRIVKILGYGKWKEYSFDEI